MSFGDSTEFDPATLACMQPMMKRVEFSKSTVKTRVRHRWRLPLRRRRELDSAIRSGCASVALPRAAIQHKRSDASPEFTVLPSGLRPRWRNTPYRVADVVGDQK
jgi:hypothetical protein